MGRCQVVDVGRVLRFLAAGLTLWTLAACDVDSFMDPSNIGRWESTPVVLPILERLDVIDEPVEEIAGLSEISDEDLIPDVATYVIGPGDTLTITVFGLISKEVDTVLQRRVDELGYIDMPLINQVKAGGKTTKELERTIVKALDPGILKDPIVTVVVTEGRQRAFTILGTPHPGPYPITKNNFRLIDAISLGGGLPPQIDRVYVIRQVSLSARSDEPPGPEAPARSPAPASGAAPAPDRAKLIEELAKPGDNASEPPADNPGREESQPGKPQQPPAALSDAAEGAGAQEDRGRYINVNGRWVLVQDTAQARGPAQKRAAQRRAKASAAAREAQDLYTQRVIEVDAQSLMRGDARFNIVIRPNDIVRVPDPNTGYVFIGGAIQRPGSYAIEGERRLTLTQAIIAAGGLDPVAIPERLDLYRRIGREQQAIVRLNLRAIKEGVQPDIFLKPDDQIEIGTNLYASFLAVIRNSFRMSYGFGFLLDRNFGNDVFGPPPEIFRGRRAPLVAP